MITHLEKFWCALWVSEGWYDAWNRCKDFSLELPEGLSYRRYALKAKAIGIVEFDRTLNKYGETIDDIVDIFVYGDKRDET